MAELSHTLVGEQGPLGVVSGWCATCQARADSRCPHRRRTARAQRRQAARDARRDARAAR